MTALATEARRLALNPLRTRKLAPLPLEDAVKAWKGGLAGFYFQGATAGEVAPFKASTDMIGIGRFLETVDNADDGESVKIESGEFVWTNGSGGDAIALTDLGKWAYGLDDTTAGILSYVATTDPVINTITPTDANDTLFALQIRYRLPGESLWRTTTLVYLSDAASTPTEQCDGLRADLVLKTELAGVITGTGTTTLVLTGAEGVAFSCNQAGPGILAVVVTEAGTLTGLSRAGVITGYDAKGPQLYSDPSIYAVAL